MSQRIIELREKRATVVAQAREELDKIDGDTSPEQAKEYEERFDKAMADADRLTARIEREERALNAAKALEAVEERQAGREDAEERAAKHEQTDDKIEVDHRAIFTQMMRFGASSLHGEERAALAGMQADITPEMRQQATTPGSAGGYLVPEGFLNEITQSMAAWGPMLDPGVTRQVNTASGNPLPWPTVDDTANEGKILDENTQASDGDFTFGQKMLGAYMYSSNVVKVSFQLLQDSAFDMEDLTNRLFGERIGRAANKHLTVGTGTGQPEGIVTGANVGHTAASMTAITADELFELEHSVDPAYRASPNTRWMFHDETFKAIRTLKDGQGNYLWQLGDVRVGAPNTFLGHPYSVNQAMPKLSDGTGSDVVTFGDMSGYIVRRVREYTMMRLVERYADYLQVGFLAYNRIDGATADANAIKKLQLA